MTKPMDLNEVRLEPVREALRMSAQALRADVGGEERLVFVMLLSGFVVDGDVLDPWHREQLEWLAELRAAYGALQILSVVGHASRTGAEPSNVGLSLRRARAAVTYLALQGVPPEAVGEVSGSGSTPAVLEVGGLEEPLNRSVEVTFAFRTVPRLQGALPSPTMGWTIDTGNDVGWVFAGSQDMTLTRLDTGESRDAVFRYIDASVSVGPSKFLNKLLPNRWMSWDKLWDELPTATIEEKLAKFLSGFLLEATTNVAIVGSAGAAQPLTNDGELDWPDFAQTVAFLLEPAAFGFPGADASFAMLLIGAPAFAGAYVSGIDPGVGSVFPELSAGVKFGTFELRT